MSDTSKANILWFLPTHGDGRYLCTTIGGRDVNFNYLRQICAGRRSTRLFRRAAADRA
jgi:hypothetical protein